MKLISAQRARMNYSDKLFTKTMEQVNEAILKASVSDFSLCIDIPTGNREDRDCVAYDVAQALRHKGYEVVLMHDPENGSSELSISW